MDPNHLGILANLIAAVVAGGLIGLERSYFARPAGFRTHALVCLASCLLMTFSSHQWDLMQGAPIDAIKADPVRMAQGIVAGIGFIGAGVIFKEGLNIRGLTTAASIWMTASIGVLIGVGFHMPAFMATVITLVILALFPWIEAQLPSRLYAHNFIRYDRKSGMDEQNVRVLMRSFGFRILNMNIRTTEDGQACEYKMLIRTSDTSSWSALAEHLRISEDVLCYEITPTGD